MPGGDKPGSSGSETPGQKTGESTTDIQSEQIEKSDIMSDPESSTSDPISNHESESGSGLQTPDLTADCSSSLPSERQEKSTGPEVQSEDKGICGAITDSEISKSDPSAESDTSSGLQSPDLKTDSSQTPTLEHLETKQRKEKDFVPMDKSCRVQYEEVEAKVVPPQEGFDDDEEDIPPVVIPQVQIQEHNAERNDIPEQLPDVRGPTLGNRVWNAICRCPNRMRNGIYKCPEGVPIIFIVPCAMFVFILIIGLVSYLVGHPGGPPLNITQPHDTFLPTENTSILNLND